MTRLSKIDALTRADHYHLSETDECYYFLEYTSRQGYSYSLANQLISNLKKKPRFRGTSQWPHKVEAMQRCSTALQNALNPNWLETATLVPVPPSKIMSHQDYDDRMNQVCRGVSANGKEVDVRQLVKQTESIEAAHESDFRPTVQDLLDIYVIDEMLCEPNPSAVAIVDDVLTAATHFKAMQTILSRRFPSASIIGVFIARRVFPPNSAAEDFIE